MTPKEQFVAGGLAILAVLVPMVIGVIRLMITKLAIMQLDLEEQRKKKLIEAARLQALVAEEERAAELRNVSAEAKAASAAKESAAVKATMEAAKVDEATARAAVKVAIATSPDLGATAEDKQPKPPLRGGRST